MQRPIRIWVLAVLTLGAYVPNVPADFTPIVGWDNQLFPSYLIATATVKTDPNAQPGDTLGDADGQLGVIVTATADRQSVTVSIRCEDFMEVSEYRGTLAKAGETYVINPKVRYRFERLSKCRQATPATIVYRVKLGSDEAEEITKTVTFRSINDCPLLVNSSSGAIDTKFAFTAYVNEQHPFVDKLLREALDRGIVDKFDGYQSGQAADVVRQVYAIWDLLAARDVRYSSITTTATDSQLVFSQHVRLIEETANNSQANCVDGSVLLVSMLRKIGINAALVLKPGHCYVAFAADPEGKITLGLETTMIAAEVEEPEELAELFDDAVEEDLRDEYSWPSFVQAAEYATGELIKQDKKLQSGDDPDYAFIDIRTWRAQGVLPIPFTGTEKFVAYDHSVTESDDEEEWDEDQEDAESEYEDEESDDHSDEDE